MSLPSAETIPDDFNQLSPAQKRRIRQALRNASESERQSLLYELKRRSTPGYDFFLFALLGAVLVGIALLLNSPIIFVASALCVPILTPLMGTSISPAMKNIPFLLQSIACFLICAILYFGFGSLAGAISRAAVEPANFHIPIYLQSNWIGWVILIITSVMAGLLMLRYDINPHMAGVLISYLVFLPIAAAGFFLTNGSGEPWLPLLALGFTYLACSTLIIMLVFLVLGLTPHKSLGWLTLVLTGAAAILLLAFPGSKSTMKPLIDNIKQELNLPTPCPVTTCESNAEVQVCVLPVTTNETREPEPTATTQATLAPTDTPQPTATPVWVTVKSESGAVIREEPGYDNPIATYATDGSRIQMLDETYLDGNTLWVKVIAADGKTGWILYSLLIVP